MLGSKVGVWGVSGELLTWANFPGRSCDRSISTGEATKSRDRSKLEVVVGKLGIGKVGVGKLGIEVGDAGDAVFNTL